MRDTELLRGLLRVEDPWDVTESKLDLESTAASTFDSSGAVRVVAHRAVASAPNTIIANAFGAISICAVISCTFMRWFPASTVPSMGS